MRQRSRRTVYKASDADIFAIQSGLERLEAAAAADATGENQARAEDVFAPPHHAHALDPTTALVLGARGTGKSFWAGVLAQDNTRRLAADFYPHLNLDRLKVAVSFSGLNDTPVTRELIDENIPVGSENMLGRRLWRSAILHEAIKVTEKTTSRVSKLMRDKIDMEDWQDAMEVANSKLQKSGSRLLIIFDALDGLSTDWNRLRDLIDSLLQVTWGLRGYSHIRAKLFLRPDQLNELNLRFVELSKLKADAAELDWDPEDLYGMLFSRLAVDLQARDGLLSILKELALPEPPDVTQRSDFSSWTLAHDSEQQKKLFERLAGPYMGANSRKGRTYDWPINHLGDGFGEVTPRSFLTLLRRAAIYEKRNADAENGTLTAITPEGIRKGLQAASRVRIDQLEAEYPWIPRALAPLGGLLVPNVPSEFYKRWKDESTLEAIDKAAQQRGFLPPLPDEDVSPKGIREEALADRMIGMGVLTRRDDARLDMPDLFRVGAALLKKGGVPSS